MATPKPTEDQPAATGKVRVRWNGATKLKGVKQSREIGAHTWSYDGWSDAPIVEMDAAAWNALTPAQRKADGFEEVA